MKIHFSLAFLALLCLVPTAWVRGQKGDAKADYWNPKLSIARRVDDLLARMTLEEKVGQMLCMWRARRQITDAQGRFDPAKAPKWFKVGIGRIERPSEGRGARAEAEFTNAIQRWVKDNTRLGIPVIFHEEALHGLQGPEATSFPQAIGLASTWNPDLVERVFAVVAREVRARGAQQVLAPVVDVARDPRWGRFEETFGEDPYLGRGSAWPRSAVSREATSATATGPSRPIASSPRSNTWPVTASRSRGRTSGRPTSVSERCATSSFTPSKWW